MRVKASKSFGLVLLLAAVVGGVVVADVSLWRSTRRALYRDALNELTAVSEVKRRHLALWLNDRMRGLRSAAPIVASGLEGRTIKPEAAAALRTVQTSDDWQDLSVVTSRGETLWTANGIDSDPPPLLQHLAAEALRTQNVAISGAHREDGVLTIDMMVHVSGDVFVLASVDALHSYVQVAEGWPTMREWARSELLRVTDGGVEYLTRPHGNDALVGRPLRTAQAGTLIAAAVRSRGEAFEGEDEHGRPAVGVARPIAGTPWLLVAITDRDAILRPLRTNNLFTLLNVGLVAIIGALVWLLLLLRRRGQTIAENARWFKRLFDDSPVAMDVSLNDELVHVNHAFARLFGYDAPEDLLGKTPFTTVAPHAAEAVHALAESELARGALIETTGRRRDGSEFPIQVRVASLSVRGQQARIAFVDDISERRNAAELLMRSRDFYMRLLDALPNPVWRCDELGRCIYLNQAWVDFTGRARESDLGAGWKESIHPDDLARIHEGTLDALHSGAVTVEYRVRHHSGEYRWVADRRMAYVDVDGSHAGYLGTWSDIHDARMAQEQFRTLVEHAADLITIIDAAGTIVYQNPTCTSLLGYTPDEVTGLPARSFLHDDDAPGLFARVCAAPYGAPFRMRHKDGSWRLMESMITRMPGHDRWVIVTSRDITERRALEEAAARNERMNALGRVAANVAHEFNNVLQSITPFATAIERQGAGQRAVVEAAGQVHRAVRRGREITQEILRFSRPEPPERHALDLGPWLADLRETMRGYAGASIDVDIELSGGPLVVSVDETQLHQAVTNLAVNACHAMPGGGTLTLRAERAGERVVLSVSDTGSGIPADVLPRIFEPMFTTKRSRGTGLGLPITQQIVAQHGGRIDVETTPGVGSTFRIHLPLGDDSIASSSNAPPARPTALVVEDDPTVAMAIEALLDLDGFAVINVATATRAIDVAAQRRPDLVVLDVGLPDMPGTELFGRLRRLHENLPTVFSTGHAEAEAKAVAEGEANVAVLVKPYGFDSLAQAVRDAGFAA